jgi:hypothetical protein
MFVVDEATAEAIRRAWHEGGDLAAVVELRRLVPLITDPARGRSWCKPSWAGIRELPRNRGSESALSKAAGPLGCSIRP